MKWTLAACLAALAMVASQTAQAQVRITEWMYNGLGPSDCCEFIEIMNRGIAAVNLNNWSFDDNSRTPDSFVISALGTLDPGEIAIITETSEATFRSLWPLFPASVSVIGGNTHNIGRNDELNLYDANDNLVDRLTYNDQAAVGSPARGPRTAGRSGNPLTLAALGANNASQWVLSNALGDPYGSYFSTTGDQGNPGFFVPEPASVVFCGYAALAILTGRRRI